MAAIAFTGLGKMGRGMAGRLLAAGHDVRVFNRTRSRAADLERAGARVCESPAEACAGVSAVFSMTADDVSSRSLWTGPDGVLTAALPPGVFTIECSTLSHDWVIELSAAARSRGFRYIDAPVTGLPEAAAAGRLTLLVGADEADLADAGVLLEPIAERVLRFGPVGAGTVYKLMINLVGAIQIASAGEGMAIAERAGLSLSVVADAIELGQAASPQVVRNTRRMVAGDHDENVVFTPALRLKDVEYALALARKLGVASPFGDVAADLLRQLCARGGADANESKIFEISRTTSRGRD
jgi:3-hydroxyisobutyrate dehydrogenase